MEKTPRPYNRKSPTEPGMTNESPNATERQLFPVEKKEFIEDVISHGFVLELGSEHPIEYALYEFLEDDKCARAILQGNAFDLCRFAFGASCWISPKQWIQLTGSEKLLTVACVINWSARNGGIHRYGPAKLKNHLTGWNKRPAAWRDEYTRAFARDIGIHESFCDLAQGQGTTP